MLAPVSNGNVSLMADLARRNNFHWDAILGAEFARDYKPKPDVYLSACEAFDLAPSDCMMVAAHSDDLAAAAACGLRTGFVARPNEKGPGRGESRPTIPVDFAGEASGRSGGQDLRLIRLTPRQENLFGAGPHSYDSLRSFDNREVWRS